MLDLKFLRGVNGRTGSRSLHDDDYEQLESFTLAITLQRRPYFSCSIPPSSMAASIAPSTLDFHQDSRVPATQVSRRRYRSSTRTTQCRTSQDPSLSFISTRATRLAQANNIAPPKSNVTVFSIHPSSFLVNIKQLDTVGLWTPSCHSNLPLINNGGLGDEQSGSRSSPSLRRTRHASSSRQHPTTDEVSCLPLLSSC